MTHAAILYNFSNAEMLGKLFSQSCQDEESKSKSSPNHSPVDLGRVPTITIVPAPPIPVDNSAPPIPVHNSGKLSRLQNMDHLEARRIWKTTSLLKLSKLSLHLLAFCITAGR